LVVWPFDRHPLEKISKVRESQSNRGTVKHDGDFTLDKWWAGVWEFHIASCGRSKSGILLLFLIDQIPTSQTCAETLNIFTCLQEFEGDLIVL
jgi:hypothetical protein